jgi:hypothetical protein
VTIILGERGERPSWLRVGKGHSIRSSAGGSPTRERTAISSAIGELGGVAKDSVGDDCPPLPLSLSLAHQTWIYEGSVGCPIEPPRCGISIGGLPPMCNIHPWLWDLRSLDWRLGCLNCLIQLPSLGVPSWEDYCVGRACLYSRP